MLDGDKYGGQVGSSVAAHFPYVLNQDEAKQLAHLVHERLQRDGIPHIYPEDKFVRSFVASFLVEQSVQYRQQQEVAS